MIIMNVEINRRAISKSVHYAVPDENIVPVFSFELHPAAFGNYSYENTITRLLQNYIMTNTWR